MKTDSKFEPIFNELKNPKYRKKGVWTNEFFRKLNKKNVKIAKSTFISRLKRYEKIGLITVTKHKNKKYIRLSDDVYCVEEQLLKLKKAYTKKLTDLFETFKKTKSQKVMLFEIARVFNQVSYILGFTIISNMFEAKTKFQKEVFSYFISKHIKLIDDFLFDIIRVMDILKIDKKTMLKWKEKNKATFLTYSKT